MPNNNSARGKAGEEQVSASLQAAGMSVVARNFRCQFGEIDIIAVEEETVVFVEVKTWSAYGLEDLQYSVDIRKRRKIIKTAKFFLSENRKYSKMAVRFDVVFVAPQGDHARSGCRTPRFYHLASAFTESVS